MTIWQRKTPSFGFISTRFAGLAGNSTTRLDLEPVSNTYDLDVQGNAVLVRLEKISGSLVEVETQVNIVAHGLTPDGLYRVRIGSPYTDHSFASNINIITFAQLILGTLKQYFEL